MVQTLEVLEFPSVCDGASSLEEYSVQSEEEGGFTWKALTVSEECAYQFIGTGVNIH